MIRRITTTTACVPAALKKLPRKQVRKIILQIKGGEGTKNTTQGLFDRHRGGGVGSRLPPMPSGPLEKAFFIRGLRNNYG